MSEKSIATVRRKDDLKLFEPTPLQKACSLRGTKDRRIGAAMTLDDLRRFAVTRSLFAPTTLKRALHRLGFVQADPIRAPARAQDLTLRQRVSGYRAGDLERRYATLDIEEDFFVDYGFVTRDIQALMHPRADSRVPADASGPWSAEQKKRARQLLAFVRARGRSIRARSTAILLTER